ncbi:MAG: 30S ribosomal protein S17 [Saccharospirillum sp.]|jgi:small subunit ribosomal protein S17|uniref:30S ribosomal protein S17 n=1 Tax=Saccharospirillum TaxID=231683 RepID=UPI000FD840EF|nr:30S ribosomal protein S17 [Saccharospirillum alexandrii]
MSEQTARTVTGQVVSNKAEKTVTVKIERTVTHPIYGKIVKRSTKMHAHDENNECQIGDFVTIEECRPLSKSKTWRLVRVEERATTV